MKKHLSSFDSAWRFFPYPPNVHVYSESGSGQKNTSFPRSWPPSRLPHTIDTIEGNSGQHGGLVLLVLLRESPFPSR